VSKMPEETIDIVLYMTDGLPCILADKFIESLIQLLPKNIRVSYRKEEVNEEKKFEELVERYNIDGLPFILVIKDGKEIKITGFDPAEIEKAILGKVMFSKQQSFEGVC